MIMLKDTYSGIGGFLLKKVTLFFEFFQIIPYIIDAINLKHT